LSYFFDTSAIVKIYHQEEGSHKVVDILNSNELIFISELSAIEYHSVLYRKFRENFIESIELEKLGKRFENDIITRFELLPFNSDVVDKSKNVFRYVAKKMFVRSLDVIQIAFFKSYLDERDIFITFDNRQESAMNELMGIDLK
jgi:uncharacterized protein